MILSTIHQNNSRDQPNGSWYPLGWSLFITPTKGKILCDVYKSITPTKGKIFCDVYKYRIPTKGTIFCNIYKFKILTKGTIFCGFYKLISKNPQKLSNLRNLFEDNQFIDCNRCNKKTGTLSTNFHKHAGEKNTYIRFGYGLLTICYHIWGQVSGSTISDPINTIMINRRWSNN